MRTSNSPHIKYIQDTFAKEDALLKEVRKKVTDLGVVGMQVGAEEGKILHFLVKSFGIKKVVELGTLGGYSAIWMARALPEDGMVYTIDRDRRHIEVAKEMFSKCEVGERITLLEGEGKDKLHEIENKGPFDMIFIDADKAGYGDYLFWAEKNIRKGGLIVGDNTFLFNTVFLDIFPKGAARGDEKSHSSMREFNHRLADPKKYNSIMIPSEEGMTIAQKLF